MHTKLMAIFCRILTDFLNSLTARFSNRPQSCSIVVSKDPATLAYFVTLTCETVMSENKRLTLQGSVATYLRRGGIVHNEIEKDLLLSPPGE